MYSERFVEYYALNSAECMGFDFWGRGIPSRVRFVFFPLANQRTVNVLHNSENPASCFAVLDTGTCLVADNLFDLLMMKLKEFYVARKNVRMESKGQRYELGDFVIKIGSTTSGQNFKGILVEVNSWSQSSYGKNLLQSKIMESHSGSLV